METVNEAGNALGAASHVTVITGAAGALGGAVVADLHARRHSLVLLDRPEASAPLDALAKDVGGLAIPLDLASSASWDAAKSALEKAGSIDGAVLIAGGWQGGKPLHESDDATFRAMIDSNLETVHRSLRALLPGMVSRGRGSIVVIGSRAAVRPWESGNAAAYAASKAAVVALAQAVSTEVIAHGVRINAVLPSTIDTRANRRAMPNVDPAMWVAPSSIAQVIAFLLSDESRDISGATIPVYGRA